MAARKREVPEDFEQHYKEPLHDLHLRYHADRRTIDRWRTEIGKPIRRSKPVLKLSETGEILERYDSITEAAIINWVDRKSITYVASGKSKSGVSCGYRWRFADDNV